MREKGRIKHDLHKTIIMKGIKMNDNEFDLVFGFVIPIVFWGVIIISLANCLEN